MIVMSKSVTSFTVVTTIAIANPIMSRERYDTTNPKFSILK